MVYTEIHDVVPADCTVIDDDIYSHQPHSAANSPNTPCPQCDSVPLLRLDITQTSSKYTFFTSKRGFSLLELGPLLAVAGPSTSIGVDILNRGKMITLQLQYIFAWSQIF